MATVEINIPQLGEGLQEARIVRFLKQVGESVQRDEPIYEMETDKAVMEIESPVAGIIDSWTAHEDDVLPIGASIGRISTEAATESNQAQPEAIVDLAGDSEMRVSGETIPEMEAETGEQRSVADIPNTEAASDVPLLRNAHVPPRTRAHAQAAGLSDSELAHLAMRTDGKLLPQAIDAYIQGRSTVTSSASAGAAAPSVAQPARRETLEHVDTQLPGRQRTLVYRLQRSAQTVVPATMEIALDWNPVEVLRAQLKSQSSGEGDQSATQFLLFAWCVAQAAADHPRFRSMLVNDSTVREFAHLHLGIAVARPNDELLMARIPNADTLSLHDFAIQAHEAIGRARNGEDQTAEAMQLSLTNMSGAGVKMGIPVVVAPAVGTLFIGAPYDEAYPLPGGGVGFRRLANMVFTFDHRLANGVGAARFLGDIQARVAGLRDLVAT